MSDSYPFLGEQRVRAFGRRLEAEDIDFDVEKMNDGKIAVYVLLHHPGMEIYPEDADTYLSEFGFAFRPCYVLDELIGDQVKYYTFKYKGGLWVALGANAFGEDTTKLYVEWAQKLDRETASAVQNS